MARLIALKVKTGELYGLFDKFKVVSLRSNNMVS